MARHQLESPPDVRMRRAEVPVALSKLVAELLAKDPARRPTLRRHRRPPARVADQSEV